jgi:hypothetical protein
MAAAVGAGSAWIRKRTRQYDNTVYWNSRLWQTGRQGNQKLAPCGPSAAPLQRFLCKGGPFFLLASFSRGAWGTPPPGPLSRVMLPSLLSCRGRAANRAALAFMHPPRSPLGPALRAVPPSPCHAMPGQHVHPVLTASRSRRARGTPHRSLSATRGACRSPHTQGRGGGTPTARGCGPQVGRLGRAGRVRCLLPLSSRPLSNASFTAGPARAPRAR